MRLIHNWRWVAKRAWSVRFLVLAAACSGITATIGVITAYQVVLPIGPITLSIICGVATFGAAVAALAARFVAQDGGTPAPLDAESGE